MKPIHIGPSPNSGWRLPKKVSAPDGGLVIGVSYLRMIELFKKTGIIGKNQDAEILRINEHGIDVFLSGPVRTMIESLNEQNQISNDLRAAQRKIAELRREIKSLRGKKSA